MEDVRECPCCRQMRPHPTQPGEWEYRTIYNDTWRRAIISVSTGYEDEPCEPGHLVFYDHDIMNATDLEDQHPGSHWWPEHAQWRKLE